MQQQQHLRCSSDSRDYQEQYLARARQQLIQHSQAPRIIKYADPHGQHLSQRPDSHDRSRSSSSSSLDIDEMLLRATTGDEHGKGIAVQRPQQVKESRQADYRYLELLLL
jgi:hypothetical protein